MKPRHKVTWCPDLLSRRSATRATFASAVAFARRLYANDANGGQIIICREVCDPGMPGALAERWVVTDRWIVDSDDPPWRGEVYP